MTATGSTSLSHDARGNITAIGSSSYGYSSENLLTSAPGSVTLAYDPMLRLYETVGSGTTTRFGYDGDALIAEYNGSNALQRRYVHGPGVDEPLAWYEGTGTSTRRWLHADERGSVVAVSDGSGDLVTAVNRYDEYGAPQGTLTGRFGYTGQAWLPEAGLWYYRARMYNPTLGRFMQTDPIGYGSGMNLYAYVRGDPVNFRDPLGLFVTCNVYTITPIAVVKDGTGGTAKPPGQPFEKVHGCSGSWGIGFGLGSANAEDRGSLDDAITITAKRPGKRHSFSLRYPTLCSAGEAFARLREAGSSAPGAPAAREGFTPRVTLSLNNPISQRVDSRTMTITNTTLPGHSFYPGNVVIRVIPQPNNTSDIRINGIGTGSRPFLNEVLGIGFFGLVGDGITRACAAAGGIYAAPPIP